LVPEDYFRLLVFGGLWAAIAGVGAYALLLNAEQRGVIARRVPFLRIPQPAQTRK
jgi:hypothetical protein